MVDADQAGDGASEEVVVHLSAARRSKRSSKPPPLRKQVFGQKRPARPLGNVFLAGDGPTFSSDQRFADQPIRIKIGEPSR